MHRGDRGDRLLDDESLDLGDSDGLRTGATESTGNIDSIDSTDSTDSTDSIESSESAAERPRERIEWVGPGAVDETDLVALILGTGSVDRDVHSVARLLLRQLGGVKALSRADSSALRKIPGVGPAKSARLTAAFELGRRAAAMPIERGDCIKSPEDVQRHFSARLGEWRRESFHVLLLDGRHRLIAIETASVGTLTASLVHPREVFRAAIRRAAAAVVLVHNHPSGDPSPSREDRLVTRRLVAAGDLLGIRVLDHVIVAEDGYFSFREGDPDFEGPESCIQPEAR